MGVIRNGLGVYKGQSTRLIMLIPWDAQFLYIVYGDNLDLLILHSSTKARHREIACHENITLSLTLLVCPKFSHSRREPKVQRVVCAQFDLFFARDRVKWSLRAKPH